MKDIEKQLESFIKTQLNQGASEEDLRNKLKQEGKWSDENVDSVLANTYVQSPEIESAVQQETNGTSTENIKPTQKSSKHLKYILFSISVVIVATLIVIYITSIKTEQAESDVPRVKTELENEINSTSAYLDDGILTPTEANTVIFNHIEEIARLQHIAFLPKSHQPSEDYTASGFNIKNFLSEKSKVTVRNNPQLFGVFGYFTLNLIESYFFYYDKVTFVNILSFKDVDAYEDSEMYLYNEVRKAEEKICENDVCIEKGNSIQTFCVDGTLEMLGIAIDIEKKGPLLLKNGCKISEEIRVGTKDNGFGVESTSISYAITDDNRIRFVDHNEFIPYDLILEDGRWVIDLDIAEKHYNRTLIDEEALEDVDAEKFGGSLRHLFQVYELVKVEEALEEYKNENGFYPDGINDIFPDYYIYAKYGYAYKSKEDYENGEEKIPFFDISNMGHVSYCRLSEGGYHIGIRLDNYHTKKVPSWLLDYDLNFDSSKLCENGFNGADGTVLDTNSKNFYKISDFITGLINERNEVLSEQVTTETNFDEWETYTNDVYNFSYKYPKEITFDSQSENEKYCFKDDKLHCNGHEAIIHGPVDIYVTTKFINNVNFKNKYSQEPVQGIVYNDYIKCFEENNNDPEIPFEEIYSRLDTIDGYVMEAMKCGMWSYGEESYVAYLFHDGKTFLVTMSGNGNEINKKKLRFKNILSTFVFDE